MPGSRSSGQSSPWRCLGPPAAFAICVTAAMFAAGGARAESGIPPFASANFGWQSNLEDWEDPPSGAAHGPIKNDPAYPFRNNAEGNRAGTGATTVNYKGGIGSASAQTPDGHTVGAIAAVNAVGNVVIDRGPWFWAAPFEQDGEFGGRGLPASFPPGALEVRTKGTPQQSTTLVVVATNAILTKAQAKRLAVMAQSGLSRAIYPVHSPLDGDVLFAASTGRRPLAEPLTGLTMLGTLAANVVARAVARAVFTAAALPVAGAMPAWGDLFGGRR